jgi:hypothetical protein
MVVPASFHALPGAPSAAVIRASQGAPAVKLCDASQIATARAAGAGFIYYRPFLAGRDEGDCADGAAWAGDVWADLQNNGGVQPQAISFRNECHASVQTAAQYLRYRDALQRFGYRGKVVLGSFSVGTPDWPEWAALKAGLGGYAPDMTDLHEYWSLSIAGSAPWYALRHVDAIRRGLLPASWPIIIGECGSDNVGTEDPQHRRGWQDAGKLTADQQIANLRTYLAGCAPSVQYAFVFADGTANPDWVSFHTFDTPVETAIRATWAQPPPGGPKGAPVASLPIPLDNQLTGDGPNKAPDAVAEVRKALGHMNPSPLFKFDQGPGTLDCWVEAIRSFFLRYGYPLDLDTVFQAGKGRARPAGGEAATFAEVKQAIATLAKQLGVRVQTMDCDTPTIVFQALRDPDTANPWTVIAGVAEQVLQPGQQYGHFMILSGFTGGNEIAVVDPLDHYDGNTSGVYPAEQLAQAMIANWEPSIDAEAVKIVGKAA